MRMTKKTRMILDRCYCPKRQGSNMIEKNEEKNTSMRNSLRRSSGRVLTGKRSLAMTNKRTSRKASRVAQQKISKNVEDLSNLGKKMRRPLNSADSTEEGDDETEEDVDAD